MKRLLLTCLLVPVFFNCGDKLNFTNLDPEMRGTFSADMSGQQSAINKAAAKALKAGNAAAAVNIPGAFCAFTKYEISVLFISINLVGDDKRSGTYVVLDRENGDGVIVDLVSERLSDKVADLNVENPIGRKISSIEIYLDKHFVINGILKTGSGALFQTTAQGIYYVADSAAVSPQECDVVTASLDPASNIVPIFKTMNTRGELPDDAPVPKASEFLPLALGGTTDDDDTYEEDDIYFIKDGVLDIKCPLDVGLNFDWGQWEPIGLTSSIPYVEGGMEMATYYAKRKGTLYYTDWIRFLYSMKGDLIPGSFGYRFYYCNDCVAGAVPYPNDTSSAIPGRGGIMRFNPNLDNPQNQFVRIDGNTIRFDQMIEYMGEYTGKLLIENFTELAIGDSASAVAKATGEINETYEIEYMRAY